MVLGFFSFDMERILCDKYSLSFSELAAKNWIAAGEHGQAASILAKRSDSSSLRVASFLALKAGESDKSRTMVRKIKFSPFLVRFS